MTAAIGSVVKRDSSSGIAPMSTPSRAPRARAAAPAAFTMAPAATLPAEVRTPVTRPLSTTAPATAVPVRTSTPAARSSPSSARITRPVST